MSDASILARLENVETRLMLRDLVSRYAYSVDNRAIDTLADLFAKDAVFRARNGAFSASGRLGIAAEFRAQLSRLGPSFHYVHDHILDLDPTNPDRARGVATAHAEVRRDDGAWQTAIRYHDSYVRQAGTWRFQERALAFLYYARAPIEALGPSDQRVLNRAGPVAADWPEPLSSWKEFYGDA